MKRIITKIFAALLLLPIVGAPALAQDNYKIKPGDVVRVEVLEDSSLNRDVIVLPDGRISFPLAGPVKAGGQSVEEVRSEVIEKLASNFATEPTVFVSVTQLGTPTLSGGSTASKDTETIYFLGEVANPGAFEIESGTTMLQALASVGGFSKFAATKRIQLRRKDKSNKEQVYTVNYKAILQGKSSIGMTIMESGDVIIVPQRRLFE
ncbi:polysaccharide biosynthesis/export family protein [uncultured Roseovarius sp.]|uniref:polysaccharide biosynthesis/export family protein n=1 Tax=uncultured Roseovarius sp. TaxID=293344 RepID=UPI002634560E|nr:polysaccharide biosynthesis/export family protein [uncultured Roseovarius sp.]